MAKLWLQFCPGTCASYKQISFVRQGRRGFLPAAGLPALPFHQMWSKWTLSLAEQELVELWPQITYTSTCLRSFLPCNTTRVTAVGAGRGIHSPSGISACAWLSSFIKADVRRLQKQERQREPVNTAPKNAAVPSALIPASIFHNENWSSRRLKTGHHFHHPVFTFAPPCRNLRVSRGRGRQGWE